MGSIDHQTMAVQEQLQHLVFIPFPTAGHLVTMAELAKLLVHRHSTLVVSLLLITSPSTATEAVTHYTESLAATSRVNLLHLPCRDDDPSLHAGDPDSMIGSQKSRVIEALTAEFTRDSSPTPAQLAGFVLDMFCTSMMDVAEEFGVPSYLFYASSAAFLGFMLDVQALHDEEGFDPTESTEAEVVFPSLAHPVPLKVFPSGMLHKKWAAFTFRMARDFAKTKGILVNTVKELEPYVVESLSLGKNPKVYPIGPILNLKTSGVEEDEVILQWLDQQPESSVVFLCFGSMGSFCAEQVKEIACALEGSGQRFLWSLRRPEGGPSPNPTPTDHGDIREVLPKGFLDRTADVGMVMGWAPQAAVLAHKSVGGFVSHCGWNSTLESMWYGVPMATWPMHAEQQFNAFLLVKELNVAAEIRIDYRSECGEIVTSEEIERGIRSLMEQDCWRKERMKGFSDKVNDALMIDGSSSCSIAEFVGDIKMNCRSESGEIVAAAEKIKRETRSMMEQSSWRKENHDVTSVRDKSLKQILFF